MDNQDTCSRCRELCTEIARYLDGEQILFSKQTVGTIADIRIRHKCPICIFILKGCGQSCSPNSELDPESVIELWTNNHRTLYIQITSQTATQQIYLLPLEQYRSSVTGRLIPTQCNFSLISRWLRSCRGWHGTDCYTPGWSELITPLSQIKVRLIDVHRRCLVLAPADCRYIALSYVWGKVNTFQTIMSNVVQLHEQNGLDRVTKDIPVTITDSIDLVAMIGERYLWVDSICIVQDDPQEKHNQVANMDAIYGNALLTINAAAGTDANAGLPGVRPLSRVVDQHVVEYCPGRRLIAAQPILTDIADNTHWNTRAWTYQERFLSKRSLTFTDKHIFFQCQRVLWCEDVVAEDEKVIDYHQMEDYLPIDWSAQHNNHMYKLHYSLHVYKSTNWVEYLRTVEEYTPRELSYDSDILAAFAGMSKVLSSMFRSPLLYGLPESLIDCALLWQPGGTLVRRSLPSSGATSGGAYFPSWSWAGWKGKIVYEDIMPRLKMLSSELVRRTKPMVEWQKQTTDGLLTSPINSVGKVGQYLLKPFETTLPEGWHVSTGGLYDVFIGTYYYHEDSPANFFAIPTLLKANPNEPNHHNWTRIIGKTSCCLLKVVPEQDSAMENTHRFSIADDSGVWCGSVWLDRSWHSQTTKLHEFIVLSEGSTPKAEIERFWSTEQWTHIMGEDKTSWYQYFNVLLVEREGAVAYRAGIGKIDKNRWNVLPTKVIEICLA